MIGDHTSTTGPATGPTVVRGMAYVRAVNSRAVLALLRARDDGLTMAEVVEGTGLSRPALEGALDELASLGWVEETRGAASSPRGGRPARRFRFRAERGCVLGVDVGPSKIDVRLADLRGRMLAAGRVTPVADRELTPAAVHDAISSVVAERSAASRLEAVAIGVPGVVGADGELTNSFVLPGWERRPIRDEFERLLDAPVTMENDANLATLTELTLGAGRGASDLVYLLLGNRISSGVVVDGRLLRGAHGSAGEVGSLPRERWHEPIEAIMNGASTEAADADRGDLVGEVFRRAAAGGRGCERAGQQLHRGGGVRADHTDAHGRPRGRRGGRWCRTGRRSPAGAAAGGDVAASAGQGGGAARRLRRRRRRDRCRAARSAPRGHGDPRARLSNGFGVRYCNCLA
ncbi:ROK family transcriptional regulator [Humibacter ginsenosidimutans]|nr:ROK family transcriptional regulator [Humibacter ginsenosidimutans]